MTDTTQQLALGGQKIVEDLRVLLTDSEEMLRLAANVPGEGVDALRDRLGAHVETLQSALGDAQQTAQRRYRIATVNTERYVRHNPWRAIGIAAGAGDLGQERGTASRQHQARAFTSHVSPVCRFTPAAPAATPWSSPPPC